MESSARLWAGGGLREKARAHGQESSARYRWVCVRKGEGVCHEGCGCRCSRLCMCARRAGWGVTEKDKQEGDTRRGGCE